MLRPSSVGLCGRFPDLLSVGDESGHPKLNIFAGGQSSVSAVWRFRWSARRWSATMSTTPPPAPPIIYLYILKYEMHPLLYPYI